MAVAGGVNTPAVPNAHRVAVHSAGHMAAASAARRQIVAVAARPSGFVWITLIWSSPCL
ncbi:hypothetical protein JG687_00009378 [Phytophthora cactorum]|uniref:Uncharacterized protein n=2 Tax=Phytophthora TaxID=4783 RepID=A0A8J5IEK6_9STRA|nr:hypothetical protein JG688_00012840 [Phytophthora aleatoria]KAG6958462.1 hypothetical protein JG687_00009378 [Phytophthora cactorum]